MNLTLPISVFQFFECQLSQKIKTLILSWSISFEANDLKPSLSGSFWSILLPTSFPRHTFLNWGALLARMCPIQSGINTRTFHSIQFWIDIRIDLWMCNIVNANSLSWMGIHRVGENNPIQFTFTNWLPSFQIKSWMGMRVCANGIRIGHNSGAWFITPQSWPSDLTGTLRVGKLASNSLEFGNVGPKSKIFGTPGENNSIFWCVSM